MKIKQKRNYIKKQDGGTRLDGIGPATCCDAVHPRWDVPKPLRFIKIACNVLRCIYQHVGIFAPDFGIAQSFIIQFSNGFQHCNDNLMKFPVICDAKSSVEYF